MRLTEYKGLNSGFEIAIKAAVFFFQKQEYRGCVKVTLFQGYSGIEEVSPCPFFYALMGYYQKKPLPANGLFWLHR